MSTIDQIAIVSGYFNPVHIGHIRLVHAAKGIAPYLVVVVNNDKQQLLKKGRIILPEEDRLEIVSEFRSVDEALLAVDEDSTVVESLRLVRSMHPTATIAFCQGGDRSSVDDVPSQEIQICSALRIEMCFGVGGIEKQDSSSRINSERNA